MKTSTHALSGSHEVDPDHVDATTDAIAGAMIDLMRQYSAIKPRITGSDGDLSPIFLLSRLTLDSPSRAVELATAMCWDASTVSRMVASLVKAGLVERRADPEDGRSSLLVPTAAGRAKVEEHRRRRGAAIAPIVEAWSPADRENLLRLVRRYTAGIAEHRETIIDTLTKGVLSTGSAAGSVTERSEGSTT